MKKKGIRKFQGYKDREFVIDKEGNLRYGNVGQRKNWQYQLNN